MTSPSTTMGSSSSGSPSSVMSTKCRVRPSRTASVRFGSSDATVSIPSASLLVAASPVCGCTCASSFACVHPDCLVPSRLRFFTQDAHARSTPSLASILPSVFKDGFSSYQCPLWTGRRRRCTPGRLPVAQPRSAASRGLASCTIV